MNTRGSSKTSGEFEHLFHSLTRAACPSCGKLVNAQRLIGADGRVYMKRFCPEHGHSSALICSDGNWYQESLHYNKRATLPGMFSTDVKRGCPYDCGLCPDHQQHTCMAQIEITNICDCKCPVCIAGVKGRKDPWFLSDNEFEFMLNRLEMCEPDSEILLITGGEPTLHPGILDFIKQAKKRNIGMVLLATDGYRIAREEEFTHKLSELGIYVYLQFDGFSPDTYEVLRGRNVVEEKLHAVENLEKYSVPTALVPTIMKGVNDFELGRIVQYGIEKRNVICVQIQPMCFTGSGSDIDFDPIKDRVTIPYILECIEDQTNGNLRKSDFISVPCHNPECGAVTYVIRDDEGETIVVSRHIDVKENLDLFKNRARISMDEVAEITGRLVQDSSIGEKNKKKILELATRCSGCVVPKFDKNKLESRITQVNIHAFMDFSTFDLERLMKCCIHTLLPDGRLIPFCAYNLFYRDAL